MAALLAAMATPRRLPETYGPEAHPRNPKYDAEAIEAARSKRIRRAAVKAARAKPQEAAP